MTHFKVREKFITKRNQKQIIRHAFLLYKKRKIRHAFHFNNVTYIRDNFMFFVTEITNKIQSPSSLTKQFENCILKHNFFFGGDILKQLTPLKFAIEKKLLF